MSKVLEKIVYIHVYPFLVLHGLLLDTNSGFRPNDSSINRILAILDNIYQGFDEHMDSIFVSLDISKAFDRVWHEGLLFKLKQNGITGSLHAWFASYLSQRRQKVVIAGRSSTYQPIHAGVPQGSILGPLLFLIYVNDMTLGLKSQAHQFADDTNLVFTFDNPQDASNIINHDLDLLYRWSVQWRVTFNALKTHFMVLSHKRVRPRLPPIYLHNEEISEASNIVTLGLTVTQTLSWNEHILKLIDKATKRLFILNKYRFILPRIALERLYIAMIRPVLEFGDIIYDSSSLFAVRALESIQRQAAIICSGAYRHTSHTVLLSELGWEPLSERRSMHKLCVFYKIYHRIYPDYLYSHLRLSNQNTYNLRNQPTLKPRHARLTSSFNSFFPSCTRDWNKLPTATQHAISINTFKSLIRSRPTSNISYNHLCSGTQGRWLARLRMELSALNSHRYRYHFIQNPICPTCGTHSETNYHYFFTCPTHRLARNILLTQLETELEVNVGNLDTVLETILFGKNISPRKYKNLLDIAYQYLSSTGRFI